MVHVWHVKYHQSAYIWLSFSLDVYCGLSYYVVWAAVTEGCRCLHYEFSRKLKYVFIWDIWGVPPPPHLVFVRSEHPNYLSLLLQWLHRCSGFEEPFLLTRSSLICVREEPRDWCINSTCPWLVSYSWCMRHKINKCFFNCLTLLSSCCCHKVCPQEEDTC